MTRRFTALVLVALLVCGGLVPVGTVGASEHSQEAFVVDLRADGSADVTLRETFDLTTDGERRAFRELQNNETAKGQFRDAFAERLRAVVASAENDTGREMTVTDAAATVRSTDDTGVVELSATWTNLAATDGDRLVLTEPFASGFAPDRPFVVRAPDGYALSTAEPAPESNEDGTARWSANATLDGFRAVAAPSDAAAGTGGSGPGFGVGAALAALAGLSALGRSRT